MYDTHDESSNKCSVPIVSCGPDARDVTPSAAIAAAVRLRYALLPYWYSLNYNAHRHGDPIVRPYCYEFDHVDSSERCWKESHSFMLGQSLLVANVLTSEALVRNVYLPRTSSMSSASGWYDFWTGKRFMLSSIARPRRRQLTLRRALQVNVIVAEKRSP